MTNESTFPTVRFSVAEHFAGADRFFQSQVDRFAAAAGIDAVASAVPWDRLWSYLQKVAEQNGLQDFSEVGTTWVGHFIDKNNLHHLTLPDIAQLGGKESFLSSAWQSTMLMNDDRVFAVPWLADTRVIYYWRSDLADAGIDETDAFVTPEKMESTLAALWDDGKPSWGAPTFQVNNTLHQIASWIWSGGGDFLDEQGKQTALLAPQALAGMCRYFALYRYMPCNFDSLEVILDAFEERRVSVICNGPWYLMRLMLGGATDAVLADLGVALPPGPPFVGGSNLVIWDNSPPCNKESALRLICRLTDAEVQREICKTTGLMPVREAVLAEAPYATHPHYRVFTEALKLGRPLPMIPFWGPLEEALLKAFGAIWEDVKKCPDCSSVEDFVVCRLEPVVKRFDRLLRLV